MIVSAAFFFVALISACVALRAYHKLCKYRYKLNYNTNMRFNEYETVMTIFKAVVISAASVICLIISTL